MRLLFRRSRLQLQPIDSDYSWSRTTIILTAWFRRQVKPSKCLQPPIAWRSLTIFCCADAIKLSNLDYEQIVQPRVEDLAIDHIHAAEARSLHPRGDR